MENPEDNATKKLREIVSEFNFHLFDTPPTHNQGGRIDLLICNKSIYEKIQKVEVLSHIDNISDHYPVQFSFNTHFNLKKKQYVSKANQLQMKIFILSLQ